MRFAEVVELGVDFRELRLLGEEDSLGLGLGIVDEGKDFLSEQLEVLGKEVEFGGAILLGEVELGFVVLEGLFNQLNLVNDEVY